MTTTSKFISAWDLIGHEGSFRIKGGRATYEAVMRNEATARSDDKVRLCRLQVTPEGIRQINRWVDAETLIWVIRDYSAEADAAHAAELARWAES